MHLEYGMPLQLAYTCYEIKVLNFEGRNMSIYQLGLHLTIIFIVE